MHLTEPQDAAEFIENCSDKDELVEFIEEHGGEADNDMGLKKLRRLARGRRCRRRGISMTERLTTLAQVKDYLEIQTDESDSFLTRLIDSASQFVLTWIGRDTFGLRSYTQNFRGTGRPSVMLFNWPVQSVTSVGIAGSAVAASPIGNLGNPSSGYVVSDVRFGQQQVNLYGYNFWSGAPSQVIYSAGFQTSQT
jgi:hypothetical protein